LCGEEQGRERKTQYQQRARELSITTVALLVSPSHWKECIALPSVCNKLFTIRFEDCSLKKLLCKVVKEREWGDKKKVTMHVAS
jgi:hypothetical protein